MNFEEATRYKVPKGHQSWQWHVKGDNHTLEGQQTVSYLHEPIRDEAETRLYLYIEILQEAHWGVKETGVHTRNGMYVLNVTHNLMPECCGGVGG